MPIWEEFRSCVGRMKKNETDLRSIVANQHSFGTNNNHQSCYCCSSSLSLFCFIKPIFFNWHGRSSGSFPHHHFPCIVYTNDGFVRKYLFVQKNQSEKTISARRPCYLFALCRDGKNCKMCRNMKMLQVMILQIWISAKRILLEWLQIKKGNACSSRKIGEEGKTPGEVEAQSFALLHSVNSNFLAKLESLILGSADNLAAKVSNSFANKSGSDLRSSSSIFKLR